MWKILLLTAILANSIFLAASESSSSTHQISKNKKSDGCSDDSSKKCKANETYVDCPDYQCRPLSCSEVGFPIACPDLSENSSCPSKPGCVCVDGFVKNSKGVCVPLSECPSCGGDKNARPGCGVNCNKHCSDIGEEPKACILICYSNACDCKDGYYLNSDGKCVRPDQCYKTPTCGKNEVFSNCTNGGCDARNCTQLGNPVPCVKLDPASCKKGCVCADGYLRADNGTCIPKSQCPSCGGDKNAKAGCGVNCNKHCSDIGEEPKACIEICYDNACDCKDGFYLNSDGKCVRPNQCNKTPTCGKNEVFSNCTNGGCDARNCSQLGKPVPCVNLVAGACKKGCVCAEGYLRADNGKCIPKSQCPSCGGDENAQAGCGVNCNKHCSDIGEEPKACIQICYDNACDCKKGYYLNNKGKCVKPDQCDKIPTCGKNEVFSNCTNGGCDARNCSQLGYPVPCIDLVAGACKKGCVCADGFLRADNGKCIPKSECPSCGGDPNAKSGCGINCGKKCSTKPSPCPKICHINACDCKDGYVYDDNTGKCVLRKNCTPTCEINEVFSNCTNVCGAVRNCSQLGEPIPFCPKIDPATCKTGCVCKDGYLRARNGTCIPRNDCPSCGGDPNAKPGCGVHCGNTCSTYKNKPVACPLICRLNGCDCKTNYVFDANTQKCVLPKDCTPTCKLNEIYSSCVNGGCEARSCSQYGKPVPCVRPKICRKGCICQKGYLRANNGTCIPKDQCNNQSNCATTPTNPNTPSGTVICSDGDSDQCLTNGNIDFTLNFLNEMVKINVGRSIVMSPFSVLIPLAELALYTDPGQSYNQLMTALNLNSKDEIRKVFPTLISSLKSQQEALLDLAAKTYVNDNAVLTKQFETDSLEVFGAKAESIDFGDTQKASDTINAWVNEVTRGLIPELVSPGMFSEYTRVVLVNAIYFLGNWETQFNPNYTNTQDFHVTSDKTVEVPMMFRKGSFKYAESSNLDCKILEIPYKGGNFSYVIFLPNEVDGYTGVADKLKNPDELNKALDLLSYETVLLSLPRHDITSSIDLTSILAQLNITDIFDSATSNLNGILEGSENLSVTSAIQKAKIKVDEVGTEAAAANAFVVGTTSVILNQIEVKADHPFLFFLLLKRSPLFCGVYAGN